MYQEVLNRIAQLMVGTSAIQSIIAGYGKVTLRKCSKHRQRLKKLKKDLRQSDTELESLYKSSTEHIRPVTSPLVLISQVQRSGGTLLSQLFDGHPELHAHPHELRIGYPKKYIWPKIDLNEPPQRWLEILFEDKVIKHFKAGYKKQTKQDEVFPFILIPSLQRKVFLKYLSSVEPITLRDVFNAYMTSYFGAWLNNQNTLGHKKFITAFTPRLAMDKDNMEMFFEIYPDGRLISIVRDPKNWYPSAVKHKPKVYGDITEAIGLWVKSAQAMLWNKDKYGDRVSIITFEDLVSKTESVIRYLAELLEIKFDEILLIPTFNKYPIRANTSFEANKHGIINATLNRYKTLLQDELEIIHSMTKEVHQDLLGLAVHFQ